jgi:hypothetical protein
LAHGRLSNEARRNRHLERLGGAHKRGRYTRGSRQVDPRNPAGEPYPAAQGPPGPCRNAMPRAACARPRSR